MKIHITNIYNQPGTQGIAQQKLCNIAREMGFHEMGLFKYNNNVDNDHELGVRIDGILSPLKFGDIVFIQSPSWNSLRYDLRLIRKIKAFKDIKIAILVHDVIPLAFDSGEANLRATIEIYNYADLIIVPSKPMLELLRQYGLTVEKQMVQEIWDYPISFELNYPKFHRRMFFTGAPSRFPFIGEWRYQTPLTLYTDERLPSDDLNIQLRSYQKETVLLSELSEGGYGLVWPSGEAKSTYYQLVQPYKVSTYLAAGIPVIMLKGLGPEQTILENGLGFVVDSLEEADAIIQSTSEEEYNRMVKRISDFNALIKDGWFSRKILTDAVMWLLNKNYKP